MQRKCGIVYSRTRVFLRPFKRVLKKAKKTAFFCRFFRFLCLFFTVFYAFLRIRIRQKAPDQPT